jgi:hypothetical protein
MSSGHPAMDGFIRSAERMSIGSTLNRAAWVGEQSAVVWKRVYFSPRAATFSKVGVRTGPPKALDAPKPTSSMSSTTTFGAPSGGISRRMGG